MSKILKRQANLRLVRRSVLRDYAVFSPDMYRFYAFSAGASEEEDGSVVCCSGSWERGWSEFLSSSQPFIVSEELLIRSTSERKTDGTQRTSQGSVRRRMRLQRSRLTVSLQCNGLLFQTFSASPRLTLPPVLRSRRFAITLFVESGGAGF